MGLQSMKQFDVPVALIVYKRLELTKQSFEAVRKIQPKKLYIIADGPRNEEDRHKVLAVRDYLDTHIDWDCEIHRNYADRNYGPRYRMPTGMAWVFETEDRAIFLEDDIVAGRCFFDYCREMLNKYENDDRVTMISGFNSISEADYFDGKDICFSYFASAWGWATWKRAFRKYDVNIRRWPAYRKSRRLKKQLTKAGYDFYSILFDDLQYHWYTQAWDYQWVFMTFETDSVGIVPRVSLVQNVGMGNEDAIHATDDQKLIDMVENTVAGEIHFPIKCPETIVRNRTYDTAYQQLHYPNKASFLKKIKYEVRARLYEKTYRQIKEMEQDDYYMEHILSQDLQLTEKEQSYNSGDKYRLTSPKQMRIDARDYNKYKKKQGK